MHKDSEKLIIFREILKVLSENKDLKGIEDKVLIRGNLAYFREQYIDTDEWEELYSVIINGLKEDKANEICYLLYNKIKFKWLLNASKIKTARQMKDIKDMVNEMSKPYELQYKRGKLRSFVATGSNEYPDWYIAYERLIQNLEK